MTVKALDRHKRHGKSYREYREFMLSLLNLMSIAYAVELHENHKFGAGRISSVTDGAIKRVHEAVQKYESDFADYALESWCKSFGFDHRISLDDQLRVKFIGGKAKKK